MKLKIHHDPAIDYVSIDFVDGIEARSVFKDGIIVREDAEGRVVGIDITDSSKFFSSKDSLSLQEACRLLNISESTMRRRIREGKISGTKPNGKDYQFKRKDVLAMV